MSMLSFNRHTQLWSRAGCSCVGVEVMKADAKTPYNVHGEGEDVVLTPFLSHGLLIQNAIRIPHEQLEEFIVELHKLL